MNINGANMNGVGMTDTAAATPKMDLSERAALEQNVRNDIQARYGERLKEGRPIKKTLDKDDFLRIMITEMKHQDPTKPMDSDRMATQMAQMTSVEQLQNLGKAMDKLTEKNTVSDRMAMSAMIGQTVTVDKGRFVHQKNNVSPLSFHLPADSDKIKMKILDERGEELYSQELEPMKKGMNTFNWDGKLNTGTQAPAGNYMVRFEAEGKNGAQIRIDPISREKVIGVSFEGGQSQFLVGDRKSPQKVPFTSVMKIEGEMKSAIPSSGGGASAVGTPGAAASASDDNADEVETTGGNNTPFSIPSELQSRINAEIAAKQKEQEATTPVKAEGFPSGFGTDSGREETQKVNANPSSNVESMGANAESIGGQS